MRDLKSKILSAAVAAITAASTVFSAYTPIYAENIITPESSDGINGTITKVNADKDEKMLLFINLSTSGGMIVLDEGEETEQHVRLEKQTDELKMDVYGKDNILISSESAKDNGYIYVYETDADDITNVKAVADDRYVVKTYEVSENIEGVDVPDDVGFKFGVTDFKYPIFMDADKTLKVEFTEKENEDAAVETPETTKEDLVVEEPETKDLDTEITEIQDESSEIQDKTTEIQDVAQDSEKPESDDEDLTVETPEVEVKEDMTAETSDTETEEKNDNEVKEEEQAAMPDSSDTSSESDDEQPEQAEENSSDLDTDLTVNDSESDSESDAENEEMTDITVQDGAETEHFLEAVEDVQDIDITQFTSARLVILANDDSIIIDKEHMIANYDNLYIMQYKTAEQAVNAYAYYVKNADAVEPDILIDTAEDVEPDVLIDTTAEEEPDVLIDTTEDTTDDSYTVIESIPTNAMTEDDNPFAELAVTPDSEYVQSENKVIALIDTGAQSGPNVIGRVSLIDDVLNGGDHGDKMVQDIVSQNPDAKILSIRAIGNDGNGSISAVVAAIEYAINQKVDIINMSLYAKKVLATTVLENEIQKAIDCGITVVGAAGNDCADVSDYIPGSIEGVWTIGACDANGNRRIISNYGDAVDYYTEAQYTSNAAAMFSGYISRYGLDSIPESGIFRKVVGEPGDTPEEDKKEDETTLYDPVIENYIKNHIDTAYTDIKDTQIVNILRLKNTLVDGNVVSDSDTIDSIMGAKDISETVLGQISGIVPVYQFDENSDYWVAYVDTMHDDDSTKVLDVMVAQNDTKGITYEDWHYDENTGLLYMPKSIFYEDGTLYIEKNQVQVMQKLTGFDWTKDFNTPIEAVTDEEGNVDSSWSIGNIYDDYTTIQVGKNFDVNDMLVCVNGMPVGGKSYGYDPGTGMLTVGFSPSVVQSVYVDAKKDENIQDIEPGVKVAGSHTFAQMNAVCSSVIEASNKIGTGTGQAVTADFCYPEGYGNWSYQSGHANAVLAYRYTNLFDDTLDRQYCNFVLNNSGGTSFLKDGKVWDMTNDSIVPFVLNLSSFDTSFASFDDLKTSNGKDLELALECCHINASAGKWNTNLGTALGQWRTGLVMLRIVNANLTAAKPFIVCAVYTQNIATQHGIGLFKVYVRTGEPHKIRLSKRSGCTWSVSYPHNYSLKGAEYSLFKKDSNGTEVTVKRLDGSEMTTKISKITTDAAGNKVSDKFVTNKYGNTGWVTLDPGTYWIRETSTTSPGYYRSMDYAPFVISEDDKSVTLSQNTSDVLALALNEQPQNGRIRILKTDENGTATQEMNLNAVFKVEYWDETTTDGVTAPSAAPNETWYMQTLWNGGAWEAIVDEDHLLSTWTDPATGTQYQSSELLYVYRKGKFMVELNPVPTLPMGLYRVTEVQAPPGYDLPSDPVVKLNESGTQSIYRMTIDAPELDEYAWLTKTVQNQKAGEKWRAQIQGKKVDENGNGLAGAEFRVYTDSACTDLASNDVLTSGADGMTNILEIEDIPITETSKTFYIKEITPPNGYTASEQVFTLTFDKSKYDELYAADENTAGELKLFGPVVNKAGTSTPAPTTPPTGGGGSGLYVKKTSKAADDIMDLKSYTLAGAEFSVTSSRGFSGTLTTDESGYSNSLTLPDNSIKTWVDPVYDMDGNKIRDGYWQINEVTTTYYIEETKAPDWHKLNNEPKKVTVTMPRDKDETFEVAFEDEPKFCTGSLDIEKLGVKGEAVVGAVFKVEYFDSTSASGTPVKTWYLKSDNTGHVKMEDSYLDPDKRSDPFFMHDGKIVIPIGGYLQMTEIAAPAEYVLNEKPKGVATDENADFKYTYANNKAWYNEYQRCRIDLKKYEQDGTTPIPGVEFEIKFLEQTVTPTSKVHPNFKRLLNVGETLTRNTDVDGKVFFDNLDQGIYQITEVKTQPGRALLKEPIIVTLPMTMTSDEAREYGNVDFSSAKEDKGYTDKWFFYNCLYEITNNAVFVVPTTGGNGTWKYGFIGIGMFVIMGTGWILFSAKEKKRKHRHKK